jgi:hypothetical protein
MRHAMDVTTEALSLFGRVPCARNTIRKRLLTKLKQGEGETCASASAAGGRWEVVEERGSLPCSSCDLRSRQNFRLEVSKRWLQVLHRAARGAEWRDSALLVLSRMAPAAKNPSPVSPSSL